MDWLDIFGKTLIPIVSVTNLYIYKYIKHHSRFNFYFANQLKVVSYRLVRFSRRAISSGIGPFSPLAYRYLLSWSTQFKRCINISNTRSNKEKKTFGAGQAYSFWSRDQLPINAGMVPLKLLSLTLLHSKKRQIVRTLLKLIFWTTLLKMYVHSRAELVHEVRYELLHRERVWCGTGWSVLQDANIKGKFTLEQLKGSIGEEVIDLIQ